MTAFQRGPSLDRPCPGRGAMIELECATGISLDSWSASMAFAVLIGKVVFVEVMMWKAYCEAGVWTIRILRAKWIRTASGFQVSGMLSCFWNGRIRWMQRSRASLDGEPLLSAQGRRGAVFTVN